MKDKEFLLWIYDRLLFVHEEYIGADYMRKLLSIADATEPDKITPNTK